MDGMKKATSSSGNDDRDAQYALGAGMEAEEEEGRWKETDQLIEEIREAYRSRGWEVPEELAPATIARVRTAPHQCAMCQKWQQNRICKECRKKLIEEGDKKRKREQQGKPQRQPTPMPTSGYLSK